MELTCRIAIYLKSNTIPICDDELGDSEFAAEWLTRLWTTAYMNRWPDSYIFEAARSHLKGFLKNWFLLHQAELITWDKYSE